MTEKRMIVIYIFMFLAITVAWAGVIYGRDLPDGDWTAIYIMGCADILALITALIAIRSKNSRKSGDGCGCGNACACKV